jgi:GT2 family glycosyltransferase
MRTRVAEYDVTQPDRPVWGLEAYAAAWVLVRAGRQPLGTLWLPVPAGRAALTRRDLEVALEKQPINWPRAEPSGGAATPAFSVVVCTRDRPLALKRGLRALAALDYPDYEVIVVDNASSSTATRDVVSSTPFRYVREDRPGLDWARNRGLAAAQHALVAYIDDDAMADSAWLTGLAAAFTDPEVMAVTGLVLPAELETEAQRYFEAYGGMGKGFAPRLYRRDELAPNALLAAHAFGVGANMAFRREALMRLGGFDTALDVGTAASGGGDLDLFHRLVAAGLTLRYEPAALAWHRHRRDLAALERQLYANGVAYLVYLYKVWRLRTVPRRAVAAYALGWVGDHLLGRLARRVLGHGRLPLRLVWAELWGALHAPGCYVHTLRSDRALRRRRPAP